jgi:sulfite exporter TauE/SafE
VGNIPVHRSFKLASYFILAAVAVGIFKVITVFSDTDITASENNIRVILNVLILALLIWLSLYISKGRNWARITFAVLTASLLVLAPFVVLKEFNTSMTIGMLSSLFGLFLFIALLLLYSKGAREWYADQLNS